MDDQNDSATGIRCALTAGSGKIVMSAWPGLRLAPSGATWIDPEAAVTTLRAFQSLNVRHVVGLCEMVDLPRGASGDLRPACRNRQIRLIRAPIPDYAAPHGGFLRLWRKLGPVLHQQVAAGFSVAFCCTFGAGRSGTLAALMLHEQGCPMPVAIRTVREGFSLAIESAVQERWLLKQRARGVRPWRADELPTETGKLSIAATDTPGAPGRTEHGMTSCSVCR